MDAVAFGFRVFGAGYSVAVAVAVAGTCAEDDAGIGSAFGVVASQNVAFVEVEYAAAISFGENIAAYHSLVDSYSGKD